MKTETEMKIKKSLRAGQILIDAGIDFTRLEIDGDKILRGQPEPDSLNDLGDEWDPGYSCEAQQVIK